MEGVPGVFIIPGPDYDCLEIGFAVLNAVF
jgi:hypothetical protein